MTDTTHRILQESLQIILKPIIRFCIHRSILLKDFVEAAKVVYVDIAAEEIERSGMEVTFSQLKLSTGVHRKDASRIYGRGETYDERVGLTYRILGHWRHNQEFQTANKRPRVLTCEGPSNEFSQLVRAVSNEVRPGSVLAELERSGAVERTKKGIRLKGRTHGAVHDVRAGLRLLAEDSGDLICSLLENIYRKEGDTPQYHGSIVFDDIDESDVPKVRKWIFENSRRFQDRAERYFSNLDQGINPDPKKKGGQRVALGIYSRLS